LHSLIKNKETELNNNCSKTWWGGWAAHRLIRGGLLAAVALAASGLASAQDISQDKKDELTYSVLPTPTAPGLTITHIFRFYLWSRRYTGI
jgi:hypothetical protein